MDFERRQELIRLIKGSPQPTVDVETVARRLGVSEDQAEAMLDELVRDGTLQVDGDGLVVVEATSERPGDAAAS